MHLFIKVLSSVCVCVCVCVCVGGGGVLRVRVFYDTDVEFYDNHAIT